MKYLLLFALMLPQCAYAKRESFAIRATKIQRRIKKFKPSINRMYAYIIAKNIVRASDRHNVPPKVLTAILKVESNFTLHAIRIDRKSRRPTDYGIGQIHIGTIRRMQLDKERLVTDLEYSILVSAEILSWFKKKFARKEKYWYARYNCGYKKKQWGGTCTRYKRKMRRYLK